MYNIPLFDLNYDESEEQAVMEVLRSRWISSGPKCNELENLIVDIFGTQYALAVTNCTAALHMAVLAAGICPGDEVIVPSLTFVATVNSIMYAGGIPVFCDIRSAEFPVIDEESIKKLITDKTRAIVVMHYAGFPCNMESIMNIAEENGLRVIEDACHGPLSEYKGIKLGTIGDIGCFSFFSNKNISTGEGGAVVTNSEELYQKMKLIRSHGMTSMSYERAMGHATEYDVVELGYNYRMDDIRASLAISQINKLEPDIEKRRKVRDVYIRELSDTDTITIPFADYREKNSSYIFPIVVNVDGTDSKGLTVRDSLRNVLKEKGIQTSVHYPPVHRFKIHSGLLKGELPVTEYYSDHEITLPMYGRLTAEKVEYICRVIRGYLK